MTAALHRVLSSPIVPHPGFEEEAAFYPSGSLSYRPRGRTTAAGAMYAKRNVVGNPIPADPGKVGAPDYSQILSWRECTYHATVRI